MIRYCIISDDSGHDFLCPFDKQEEAIKWLEAIEAYWGGDPSALALFDAHCLDLDGPDYIDRVNIGKLTFTDPVEK